MEFEIGEGTRAYVEATPEGILLKPVTPKFIRGLRGKYRDLPLELVAADLALSQQAAAFKATRKMSHADCFAAALAKIRNCELLTGDAEFKGVDKEIRIRWLNGG